MTETTRRDNDLVKGRNGNHRYNLQYPPPPMPEPKYLKDGETLAKHQPKRPKPKHNTVSVSTISGMLEKPGLKWGAAKETAELAVYGRDKWAHLPDEQAFEMMRTYFDRVWGLKAQTGNIVHHIALQWALGNYDVDLMPFIQYDDKGRERDWSDEEAAEVLRRVNGCCDALELFYLDQRPTWRYVEQAVILPSARYRHGDEYVVDDKTSTGGCFDVDGELREFGNVLGDYKTGSPYAESETLQLAGYQRSKLLATYDNDGYLVEINDYVAPRRCASIHLNDNGTYDVFMLPVNGVARNRFAALRRQYEWTKVMNVWSKEHMGPLPQSLEIELAASLDETPGIAEEAA